MAVKVSDSTKSELSLLKSKRNKLKNSTESMITYLHEDIKNSERIIDEHQRLVIGLKDEIVRIQNGSELKTCEKQIIDLINAEKSKIERHLNWIKLDLFGELDTKKYLN